MTVLRVFTRMLCFCFRVAGGNLGWVDGDPISWHTGCKVYKGVKWTMQKFAEVPMPFRKQPPPAPSHRDSEA